MSEADRKRDPEFIKARRFVFRLLKHRLRSVQEIRIKLREKGMPEQIREAIIHNFLTNGLLDDRLFTRAWIHSRLKKPIGITRIHRELKKKGIPPDIIGQETERALNEYDEFDVIRQLAQHRLRQYRHLNQTKARRRLYAYLIRRGFSSDLIFKILREIFHHDRE